MFVGKVPYHDADIMMLIYKSLLVKSQIIMQSLVKCHNMMQIYFLKDWLDKCHIIVMLVYLKCLLVKQHISLCRYIFRSFFLVT